jgi:murein L,D-transpeptidase YafK
MTTPAADRVLIEKRAHRLTLLRGGRKLKSYRVALGTGGLARKLRQGDRRVPEGVYRIDARNAQSGFHLALHISYPDAADVLRARAAGYSPGGDVMIHGLKNGYGWLGRLHAGTDWTLGCIAVTDQEIEEIWRLVPIGTAVEIRP